MRVSMKEVQRSIDHHMDSFDPYSPALSVGEHLNEMEGHIQAARRALAKGDADGTTAALYGMLDVIAVGCQCLAQHAPPKGKRPELEK